MQRTYSHCPQSAGNDILDFCIGARRQLRARLSKPAETDEMGWIAYTESLVRIARMDRKELHSALANPELALDHWDQIGHFYAPIAFYDGAILKYQGIATKGNQDLLRKTHPEGITLDQYRGDRIRASDFSVVL
jgi:hypothetical protein